MNERKYVDVYLPSHEEISKACEKIQAGWTDEERHRRSGGLCEPDSAESSNGNPGESDGHTITGKAG